MRIKNYFENIHLTESCISAPTFEGSLLTIPVRGIFLAPGHPLYEKGAGPYSGIFYFIDVYLSKCQLTEYIGDPKKPDGFKEPYIVEGVKPRKHSAESTEEYFIEGLLLDSPAAWVDWNIVANSFEFEILE